jgi:N-acetylneuraminate synthase
MFEKLDKNRCYIISEIGGNFTTYEQAMKLIDAAVYSGVDAVKLQTYRAETISSRIAMFDMENVGVISQFDFFKKYEIDKELHKKIFDYAEEKKLDWFSTPSHPEDVEMLNSLGVNCHKIGADDATNLPFLKYVAKTKLPIILSTGMCTLMEVEEAVNAIEEEGNNKIVILHTISGYPTHPEDINLNSILTLKARFPHYHVGFSDHSLSTTAVIAAATMGASVIERHFTLDKKAEGPDHILSSTPDEMKHIVDTIREIEVMKGSYVKMPFGPEVDNRKNNRKSIVAIKDIKKGENLTEGNIYIKRPGTGIAPKFFESIIGKTARSDIEEDKVLAWNDFF